MEDIISSPPIPVTGISHEGRGIAYINGKVSFIEGALPNEIVLMTYTKKGRHYNEGKATHVLKASAKRTDPRCSHYGICGGCDLQHLNYNAQLQHKEKTLLKLLSQLARIQPNTLLPPLTAKQWQYRRRGRLGVKYVDKKKAVLVGFREKNSRYLAQLKTCATLDPRVGHCLIPLQQLIHSLSAYKTIPQIEFALDDQTVALVFRHLTPLDCSDQNKLKIFAKERQIQLYLQPKEKNSIHCLWPDNPQSLRYQLKNKGYTPSSLEMLFKPTHFIQINADINSAMISRTIDLLAPTFSDQILDLFCGLGNFSLALATRCQRVTGIEGCPQLVDQARQNAMHNAITNAFFYSANLTNSIRKEAWAPSSFNKILLDPPRSGALEIIQQISNWDAERIVYVSCNPATLARDAAELKKQGYKLQQMGLIDMFPQTHHSEAICLFTK